MIADSSALMAVLASEPHSDRINELLGRYGAAISAATLVEVRIVAHSRGGARGARRLDGILRQYSVEVIPFDERQADIASAAYRDYGRGSGHSARLNYGDTFSYALAYARDEPLLYVGDDFSRTDIRSALEEYAEE